MRKGWLLTLSALLALAVLPTAGRAQSAKSSAKAGNINLMATTLGGPVTTPWQTVLTSAIRTSQQKDLFVGVSLESSLFTRGKVRSRNKLADRSSVAAGVEVQVLIDGQPAYPGPVVFNRRRQELTATFQGILASCLTTDPTTGAPIIDEACIEPEDLELILDTTSANHYNFVADDVGVGDHAVLVQARINLDASFQTGESEASAIVGHGTVTVEEVRLLKGVEVFEP